ncbi:MAG: hypothetical protein MUC43_01830 [Pirellula sp.]|jgi:hypothetical protein|nr:hypothetical protein [Pirellula sp.]
MIQSDIEACMNDSERALKNLGLLLESITHQDESVSNAALESLENCGPPRAEQMDLLLKHLLDTDSLRVFWAATLIGRLLADDADAIAGVDQKLQKTFAARLADQSLEESAREKICWAISNLPMVSQELRNVLAMLAAGASPRMQRLIEAALSKA